jgi:hypothetical protein
MTVRMAKFDRNYALDTAGLKRYDMSYLNEGMTDEIRAAAIRQVKPNGVN